MVNVNMLSLFELKILSQTNACLYLVQLFIAIHVEHVCTWKQLH